MGSIHYRYARSFCWDMGIVRRPFSSFGRVETHRCRLQPYLARSSLVDLGSHPATYPSRVFLVRLTFDPGLLFGSQFPFMVIVYRSSFWFSFAALFLAATPKHLTMRSSERLPAV